MPNRPIRLFRPFRRRLLRRGASWRARSQDGALHTVGPVLRGHQGVSLVIAALLVVATGVVTLALGPAPATADPNLPDVTVHVTTAPMTNLTLHTGVTRTASCPTGSLVVGGGGYLRNASNPATAPTNGLVLGGTNPSTGTSPVDQPVFNGATNPTNWMAIANFTGASESGDQAAAFALCSSNGPTHTVVVSTTTTGSNATQESQPPILTIATCPAETTLIGGGAFTSTPDQVNDGTTVGNSGNLKPMGSYPSDSSGTPATDKSTSATSWSAYGSAGMKNASDTVTSLALCTSDPIGPVQVARQDISSTTGGVITATPVCPAGTRLLGGGFRSDETVSGTSGLQPQQGYHMRGSYPSTGSGTPPTEVTDATPNPTAWTALVQAGGAPSSGSADLHAFAMCAQPTTTPSPSPSPSLLEGVADPNLSPLMNALSNTITDSNGKKVIALAPPCAMTSPYQGLSDIDKLNHSIQANDGCLQFVTTFTGP